MRYLILLLFVYYVGNTQTGNPWFKRSDYYEPQFSITVGINLVHVSEEKKPFEIFNGSSHMAMITPLALNVDYRFSRWFSVNIDANYNKWRAGKGKIGKILIDNDVSYFGSSFGVNVFISSLFYKKYVPKFIEFYISPNIGYFRIDADAYSHNLGFGLIINYHNGFSTHFKLQNKFQYKTDETQFNQSHQQAFFGIKYTF